MIHGRGGKLAQVIPFRIWAESRAEFLATSQIGEWSSIPLQCLLSILLLEYFRSFNARLFLTVVQGHLIVISVSIFNIPRCNFLAMFTSARLAPHIENKFNGSRIG